MIQRRVYLPRFSRWPEEENNGGEEEGEQERPKRRRRVAHALVEEGWGRGRCEVRQGAQKTARIPSPESLYCSEAEGRILQLR